MDFSAVAAEVLRILGPGAGAAVGGPWGAGVGAVIAALSDRLDEEEAKDTPEAVRKMKQKRREHWIDFCAELEKEKQRHLKAAVKAHGAIPVALRNSLNGRAAAELRQVITADILETENRTPSEQEVNIFAEAVSARARQEL